ncbi:hypothetical protein E2C01_021232 [Portunus trituberculatus]|uniref:Uncharacterized protein n=1 Tax=Portunus trituberculatus TaxID=210409 RepID=A0A5B7E3N5_PORTR|nr:hypothetical protein [Portunus trituberculatus]
MYDASSINETAKLCTYLRCCLGLDARTCSHGVCKQGRTYRAWQGTAEEWNYREAAHLIVHTHDGIIWLASIHQLPLSNRRHYSQTRGQAWHKPQEQRRHQGT